VVGRLPPKIDEQPVAFATIVRSPKSWVTSRTYGVSPHPAHAPENSKRGWSICDPFTVSVRTLERSSSGIVLKNSQPARSRRSCGSLGAMSSER